MSKNDDKKNGSPCEECLRDCDEWDAQFCCVLCAYMGADDCENCDPDDI